MANTNYNEQAARKLNDCLLAMIPLALLAVYLYGARPAIMLAISAVTAMLGDIIVAALRMKRPDFLAGDASSIVYALIFTFMLPASINYGVVISGSAFTVLLGKQAFGGYSGTIFHPSAFGFCASAICWPETIFKYPSSFSTIGLGFNSGALVNDAPAYTIKLGGVPNIDKVDLLLGDYPGPMGATFCIILLAIIVLFITRGTITWHIPVSYLLTSSLFAFVFPRIQTTRVESILFETISGVVIFASVFLVTSPFTSPAQPSAKLIFGVLVGIVGMIFSYFGAFQIGSCFALLLIEPLVPYLDRKCSPKNTRTRGGSVNAQ